MGLCGSLGNVFPTSFCFRVCVFLRRALHIQTSLYACLFLSLQTGCSYGTFLVLFSLCYGIIFIGFRFDFRICLKDRFAMDITDNLRFYLYFDHVT